MSENYWDNKLYSMDSNLAAAIEYNEGIDPKIITNILATHEGERDEENWAWIVQTNEGFVFLEGGCDYTGWD